MKCKKIIPIFFVAVMLILGACKNKQMEMLDRIKAKENAYSHSKNPNEKMKDRKELTDAIDVYVMNFPRSEKSPELLYLASKVSIEISDIDKALEYLTKLQSNYTNFKKYEDVIFDMAVMYDSRGDVENSKKCFVEYLTKYPEGKNVIIARQAIAISGKDLNTYVKGF